MAQKRIDELTLWVSTSTDCEKIKDFELRKRTFKAQVVHMKEIIQTLKSYQKEWDMLEKKKNIG